MRNGSQVCFLRLAHGAVVIALLGLFPAIAAAQVTTIQVPSGGDIQTAINQAAAIVTGATPTDVVIDVAPGTYIPPPQIEPIGPIVGLLVSGINNPAFTVTLRATEGPSQTTIDVSNVADVAIRGVGVRNLVIEGFTIRNRIPNADPIGGVGIALPGAGSVTIVNCHIDTRDNAIQFFVFDPALSAEYRIIGNTILAGQGSDPNAPDGIGAGVAFATRFAPGTVPTGEIKLIVTSNVIRTNWNCVRFIDLSTEGEESVGEFGTGGVVVTGNDMSSGIFSSTVEMLGGHAHIVAENHAHDSANGFLIRSASGVIENNLIVNGVHGVIVANDFLPTQRFPAEPGIIIRHNTIADNAGTGIIYVDLLGTRDWLPNVYNNIVAFNNASGFASVSEASVVSGSASAFIPVSFNLASNDVFGNTLKNINFAFVDFNYVGISNPQAEGRDYSGVINTGLDLAVNPEFNSAQTGDFTLQPGSPLINAGLTTRPTPFQDLALSLRDTPPDIGAYEFEKDPPPKTVLGANTATSATQTGTKRKVLID
jgi:hypothetical protein